ncbi:vegetative cell wall protein gp1-like isoform X3 [Panicum virgatum]|uniref:vegetative cell wall protein gp1-like isoform X3 n=1 Tax=Panicum virgatum TaxID=38727 RepID=UPI0019D5952B|nr:vegetative cell wall protein gp1-like isoform X3 [Panicum virgatum]
MEHTAGGELFARPRARGSPSPWRAGTSSSWSRPSSSATAASVPPQPQARELASRRVRRPQGLQLRAPIVRGPNTATPPPPASPSPSRAPPPPLPPSPSPSSVAVPVPVPERRRSVLPIRVAPPPPPARRTPPTAAGPSPGGQDPHRAAIPRRLRHPSHVGFCAAAKKGLVEKAYIVGNLQMNEACALRHDDRGLLTTADTGSQFCISFKPNSHLDSCYRIS